MFRHYSILVSTDVAAMCLDVDDLNLSINIGLPKTAWKLKQQQGRVGRNGLPAIDITLIFPQKGEREIVSKSKHSN